jgi:hypothetical protein
LSADAHYPLRSVDADERGTDPKLELPECRQLAFGSAGLAGSVVMNMKMSRETGPIPSPICHPARIPRIFPFASCPAGFHRV